MKTTTNTAPTTPSNVEIATSRERSPLWDSVSYADLDVVDAIEREFGGDVRISSVCGLPPTPGVIAFPGGRHEWVRSWDEVHALYEAATGCSWR